MVPNSFYPTSLDLSLKEVLRKVLMAEDFALPRKHSLSICLFKLFQIVGCDYFELISVLADVDSFSERELDTLISLAPAFVAQLAITTKNIRQSIPRWTSSRYHTAPIDEIVEKIKKLLTENVPGVTVFNSNLNPRAKRSVNDQYILLISNNDCIFLDINRKTATKFVGNKV